MKKRRIFALLLVGMTSSGVFGEVTPSVELTTYYADIDGTTGTELRGALQTIISTGYTSVSYDNLSYMLKYADTEEANGTDLVDIYTPCAFTVEGDRITWSGTCAGATNVGCGLNREHTVPQSWFGKASPMVSDAFHTYATDAASNTHRNDNPYGECTTGVSYTGTNCNESGRLGVSNRAGYTGNVYEPDEEYKGDIARGYFYMVTRYWNVNFTQGENGDGDEACFTYIDNKAELTDYAMNLMLEWHREDPVSEKELIRNEVIYGNSGYNLSAYKQNNRNPFIDYPELVEYLWGNKKTMAVNLSTLRSAYTREVTVTWKLQGETYLTQVYEVGDALVLPEVAPTCDDKTFQGWTATRYYLDPFNAPSDMFTTAGEKTVTENVTYYAVFK